MEYQWYPGHMAKAKKDIQDSLKLVDVIIELLDARIPVSSKNPDIDGFAKNKPRVILLNKADLADAKITDEFRKYYTEKGFFAVSVNSKGGNLKIVTDTVKEACREKIEKDRAKGMINRPIRAVVLGIPNVGKSTFINSIAKKYCAKTGDKPGVTTGKQWIRLSKDLELLDTPGILWPKFEDKKTGLNIALIGSINANLLDNFELATHFLEYVKGMYPGIINARYNVSEEGDGEEILNLICTARSCVKKGGVPDLDRMAFTVLDDFRSGKLGKVSLDRL